MKKTLIFKLTYNTLTHIHSFPKSYMSAMGLGLSRGYRALSPLTPAEGAGKQVGISLDWPTCPVEQGGQFKVPHLPLMLCLRWRALSGPGQSLSSTL